MQRLITPWNDDRSARATRRWTGLLLVTGLFVAAGALPLSPTTPAHALEKEPSDLFWAVQDKAEWGEAEAQFALGVMYLQGGQVERNDEEAAKWIYEAAQQDHVQAMYQLSEMLENGTGVEKDVQMALHWHKAASAKGIGKVKGDAYYRNLLDLQKMQMDQQFQKDMLKEKQRHQAKLQKQKQRHDEKMARRYDRYDNDSIRHHRHHD